MKRCHKGRIRQRSTKPERKRQRRRNAMSLFATLRGGGGSTCRSDKGHKGKPKVSVLARAQKKAQERVITSQTDARRSALEVREAKLQAEAQSRWAPRVRRSIWDW